MNCWIKIRLFFICLIATTLLPGCETTPTQSGGKAQEKSVLGDDYGILLTFSEREREGTELFKSRMYIDKNYLYINDDRAPDDFLLFNRANRTIYSVTHANKTVFVIKPKEIKEKPPIEIKYVAVSQPSSAIPKVSGRTATHYRYMANGSQCYDAVTLDKTFLSEAVDAMKEYRQVLAGEHASTVHKMPKDVLEPCDLALNIYHATQHLDTGLPMREWDQKGFLKFMVNYQLNFKMDPGKFDIPAEYKEFSIDQ